MVQNLSSNPPESHDSSLIMDISKKSRLSSKLTKSTSSRSIANGIKHMNHDKSIKLLLKNFKKLELASNKYNSKFSGSKSNTSKVNSIVICSNVLRTTLLPFLRLSTVNNILVELSGMPNSKVYASLVSVLTSLLTSWWSSLLNSLISTTNMPSIDRSVHLECISRILSRAEWLRLDWHKYIEETTRNSYCELLSLTLDFSLNRLASIKHIPLSISAFIGKVCAYAFFKLEGVSNALLFLLNVKQQIFEDLNLIFNTSKEFHTDSSGLYKHFPLHLHYLIDFRGLQNKDLSIQQKSFLNCLVPPKHPVKGIKDPNGPWARRWFNSDSDIFNSFLRHYLLVTNEMLSFSKDSIDGDVLLHCPGFKVILSHIYQIYSVSITRISNNNSNNKVSQEFNVKGYPSYSVNKANDVNKQNDIYYNSIFKTFRTLRDVKHNMISKESASESIVLSRYNPTDLSSKVIVYIDTILMSFAKKTSVHDFNRNSLLLNVVQEFINYVEEVNWEFWLNCCYLMLEHTHHTLIVLKTFSFLFNVWDSIPELVNFNSLSKTEWLIDVQESFKGNFINWLISNRCWERYFIHWSPLVRNYYIRILIWRVVGFNNFESSFSIKRSLSVEKKLLLCFEIIQDFIKRCPKQVSFKPDTPLINKKISIVSVTKDEILLNDINLLNGEEDDISNLFSASELKKTHPFEIFDEAVYSCSSLAEQEETEESERSNSLVSSIGKIFKLLTTDNKGEQTLGPLPARRNNSASDFNSLAASSRTVSLTSLSTYSIKSRSSSPSILSFNSTPTSLTDISESSSIVDVTEISNDNKFFKLPPEIIRPLFRFEMVFDHDSIRDKQYLMGGRNLKLVQEYRMESYSVPPRPEIPTVSLYLQSDVYNQFHITTDELVLTVNDHDVEVEGGLFQNLDSNREVDLINIGKSLFEWQYMVEEFTSYLINKVDCEQFSDSTNMTKYDYSKRIIPLLSLDSDPKTLNAA